MTSPMSPGSSEAVLSCADIGAESSLLRAHDLTALHRRLEGAIRRRQTAGALLAGAAALVAASGLAILATRDATPRHFPDSPPPRRIVAPIVVALPATPAPPCTASEAPRPSKPPSAARRVPAQGDGADDGRIVLEGSRLREQLRIFDDAERALAGGDPERALTAARLLRERYPNGPLELDAAVVGVRALRALARDDEARTALTEAEGHPLAAEKRIVLTELRAQLTLEPPASEPPPSRVIDPAPRLPPDPKAPGTL